MSNVAVKATSYCLNYAAELGLHYGTTPYQEYEVNRESPFLKELAASQISYEKICSYAPNLTYIGKKTLDELEAHPSPWFENLEAAPQRFGKYGEIMPEDEFLGLLAICDVFDLIWLTTEFVAAVKQKLAQHPVIGATQIALLKEGHGLDEIMKEAAEHHALPLYFDGAVVGCCRQGHDVDPSLTSHILLENLSSKAGAVLSLLHLIKNAGMKPEEIDFVVDCSEEAVGDINQRGGGNMAKAVAETAGCVNASGFDVRAFCAAPVAAIITSASMVSAGARKNVAVVSGGSVPKLFMNSREHLKKKSPALENCLGCFAVLLTPEDGVSPVIRLDTLGKHSVGAGASPQAVTTALVWEPLQAAGLGFADVDKYAAELHDPEVTVPAGAGNVPEANFKMIAALAVMKGQCERAGIADFVKKHGMAGFAPTQGHIPSGVPFLGHAVDAISSGKMSRAMIIGKGSLFLGRLTNLADGASFLVEKAGLSAVAQSAVPTVTKQDVESVILEVLADMASKLKG